MLAVVRRAHAVPSRPPLRVWPGDRVMVGQRSEEWPAFVFVTCATGEGWVPARHLSTGSGPAVVLVAYDTTELAVRPGQVVTVVERDDPSGWWWCRSVDGAAGWVPVSVLDAGVGPDAGAGRGE